VRIILGGVVAVALVVPAFAGIQEVRDVPVYNNQNQKLGEVSEVLATSDGNVTAAIVKVEDGAQAAVSQVAVPIEQMKVENAKIIIAMSRDQLIEQPPVDD